MPASQAYCTLLYTDAYLPGALVLGHALREYGTTRSLAVLVGSQVSEFALARLRQVFDHVIPTETISNSSVDAAQFKLLGRPELERSYTKIHIWRQLQFSRIVFLDADTLPLRNIDSLFDLTEGLDANVPIAAAPDIGWPDIFNSGVFVTCPSLTIYNSLVGRAKAGLSFDGGDQGLLNQYFEDRWQRLPFTYNVTPSSSYQYAPAYQHYRDSVNVVHFIGSNKPWSYAFTGPWHNSSEFDTKWWSVYNAHYDGSLNAKDDFSQSQLEFKGSSEATSESKGRDESQESNSAFNFTAPAPQQAPVSSVTIEADIHRWDATKYRPPMDSKPEAANLVIEHYHNAWDASPQSDQPHREVRDDHHHGSKSAHGIKPIFPWELRKKAAAPERVFPDDSDDEEEEEEEEEEPEESEPVYTPQPTVPPAQENTTRVFHDYSVGPSTSKDIRAANAWDDDPRIQKYVSHTARTFGYNSGASPSQGPYDDDEEDEDQDDDQELAEKDVTEGIVEAERELAASTIVHEKISSEDDSGILLKRGFSKKATIAAGESEDRPHRVYPVTPNPVKARQQGFTGGLSDASDGDDSDGKDAASSVAATGKATADQESWDPHAKLAELAELSALISAKQVEFEKRYEEKFGKAPKKKKN